MLSLPSPKNCALNRLFSIGHDNARLLSVKAIVITPHLHAVFLYEQCSRRLFPPVVWRGNFWLIAVIADNYQYLKTRIVSAFSAIALYTTYQNYTF